MPRFARNEWWSDYQANGGTRLDFVPSRDLVSAQTIYDVTGEESHTIGLVPNSRLAPIITERTVIRKVSRNAAGTESIEDWRVAQIVSASGAESAPMSIVCRSPLFDLALAPIYAVDGNGVTTRSFTIGGETPTQLITNYVLTAAAAAGMPYFSIGTITPTAPIDLIKFSWATGLSLLQQLAKLLNCELQTRQNGNAGFFIDLVQQINIGAPMPTVRSRKNLIANTRTRVTDDLVTRCEPRGAQIPGSEEYHSLARMVLVVTAVSGALITVADPAGAVQMIRADDEYNGWAVYRQLTGGTFDVVDTLKNTQQLQLTTPHTVIVGERLELRQSDARTLSIGVPAITPASGSTYAMPYISAVDGADPTLLTLGNATTTTPPAVSGPGKWINFDNQYVDLYARLLIQTFRDTNATISGGTITFSTAAPVGTAIGFLVMAFGSLANAAAPYGAAPSGVLWEITSINPARTQITVKPHYTNRSDALGSPGAGQSVIVFAPGTQQRIVSSTTATNKIKLDANPSAAVGNLVLLDQKCAGNFSRFVQDPIATQAPPTGFGVVSKGLDRPDLRGEGNIWTNARFGHWANPSLEPDGCTTVATGGVGFATEFSQNTNPQFVKYGAHSWFVTFIDSARSKGTIARFTFGNLQPIGYTGLYTLCAKLSLFVGACSGDVGLAIDLVSLWDPNFITKRIATISTPGSTNAQTFSVAPGGYYDLTIPGIDMTMFQSFETRNQIGAFALQLSIISTGVGPAGGALQAYVDAIAGYQIQYNPGTGVFFEGSGANQLADAGHAQLDAYDTPTKSYALKVADFERMPNTPWPEDVFVKGGKIDFHDIEQNTVDTPRVARMTIDELNYENSEFTVSTVLPRLTTLLLGSAI
jgi:hypothetical protein